MKAQSLFSFWQACRIALYVLCAILALGLTACISFYPDPTPLPVDPKLVDHSFITSQPCAAPCWYGLGPDQSSETEALAKLNELPFVNHAKINELKNANIFKYSNASEIIFECAFPGGITCGMVVSVNGVVKYITLNIQYPLPLKSVIDQMGAPEYILGS